MSSILTSRGPQLQSQNLALRNGAGSPGAEKVGNRRESALRLPFINLCGFLRRAGESGLSGQAEEATARTRVAPPPLGGTCGEISPACGISV